MYRDIQGCVGTRDVQGCKGMYRDVWVCMGKTDMICVDRYGCI